MRMTEPWNPENNRLFNGSLMNQPFPMSRFGIIPIETTMYTWMFRFQVAVFNHFFGNTQHAHFWALSNAWSWRIWVLPKIGVPQNGWFIMENPLLKRMIWGYHYFRKHSNGVLGLPFLCWTIYHGEYVEYGTEEESLTCLWIHGDVRWWKLHPWWLAYQPNKASGMQFILALRGAPPKNNWTKNLQESDFRKGDLCRRHPPKGLASGDVNGDSNTYSPGIWMSRDSMNHNLLTLFPWFGSCLNIFFYEGSFDEK